MQLRLWPGVAFALCALAATACNNGPSFTDGGVGDGTLNNGGTGQVKVRHVTPDHGPLAGGTSVVIDGQGFVDLGAGDAIVVIGGRVASQIGIVDDFTITATVPAGVSPGPVDVYVANKNGYGQLGKGYAYNALPTVTGVMPPRGDMHGGTAVTITGTGFQKLEAGTNTVSFGDLQATDVTVVSDTKITATTPPGVPFSAADVAVTNANGTGTDAKAYTYTATGLVTADGGPDANAGLYLIDLQTGLLTRFLKTELDGQPIGFHALATDGNGIIWGVTHYAAQPYLVKMDPYAQTVTEVGVVTDDGMGGGSGSGSGSAGQTFECGELEFVGPTLYCMKYQGAQAIYTIDTSTASAHYVATTANGATGLAEVNGVTYATSLWAGQVGVIDPTTGVVSNPVAMSTPLKKPASFGGKLYGLGGVGGGFIAGGGVIGEQLYQLDPTTGQATMVTNLPVYCVSLTKIE